MSFRSQIHERTITIRFLGIILSWGFCINLWNYREGGMVFIYSVLYSNFTVEICKRLSESEEMHRRLREYEEIEISRWLWITRRKTPKTFVWISSNNSASGFASFKLWSAFQLLINLCEHFLCGILLSKNVEEVRWFSQQLKIFCSKVQQVQTRILGTSLTKPTHLSTGNYKSHL